MRSNDRTLARRVTLHELEHTCVIEVDGDLDLIGGYDLRQAFSTALHGAKGELTLDLSNVTAVDDHGLASLEWCSTQAVQGRRVLTWTSASQPLVRDLKARLTTPSRALPSH